MCSRSARRAVPQYLAPDQVAIAFDHSVRAATLEGLFGIKRRVNSAEHHPGASLPCRSPNFIAAQRVAGMDANPDHVALLDALQIEMFQRLIADLGIAERVPCCSRQYVKPAWRYYCGTKRGIAWVHKVNFHVLEG